MKYWDSSAVVPLLTEDAATDRMQAILWRVSIAPPRWNLFVLMRG